MLLRTSHTFQAQLPDPTPSHSRLSRPPLVHLAEIGVEKTDGTHEVDVTQEDAEAASQQDILSDVGSSNSTATPASRPRQMGPALVPVFKAAITLVKECVWKTEARLQITELHCGEHSMF